MTNRTDVKITPVNVRKSVRVDAKHVHKSVKAGTTVMPVLTRADLKPGQTYVLKQLTYGVKFTCDGQQYETVTHPPIWSSTRPGCKRDCWNITEKRMDQIDFNRGVVVLF